MMNTSLLQAHGLSRSYGDFQAVKPLDLELNAAEITLIYGPNGAGKSTLLLCLSGLLHPTHGSIRYCGFDLYEQEVEAKRCLAFVPDVPHFYLGLTVLEHMRFISLAYGTERGWEKTAESLLTEFGLWEARNMYPHNLSRGMRLKLGISLALNRPFKVLLMDEPTSALDPQSVAVLVNKLISISMAGCAVLLTSHDVNLAGSLHGRCLSMEQGEIKLG